MKYKISLTKDGELLYSDIIDSDEKYFDSPGSARILGEDIIEEIYRYEENND